jgi:hypothetical protein
VSTSGWLPIAAAGDAYGEKRVNIQRRIYRFLNTGTSKDGQQAILGLDCLSPALVQNAKSLRFLSKTGLSSLSID